jgi:hypothetical protein
MTETANLTCDRCGTGVTINRFDVDAIRNGVWKDWVACHAVGTARRLDFCPDCWQQILEFAQGNIVRVGEEAE